MKPRKLRDIAEVPGFGHQDAKINFQDTLTKAERWLQEHNAKAPTAWTSNAGVEKHVRREAFMLRAKAIEAARCQSKTNPCKS